LKASSLAPEWYELSVQAFGYTYSEGGGEGIKKSLTGKLLQKGFISAELSWAVSSLTASRVGE
jgi:hypothetical protein